MFNWFFGRSSPFFRGMALALIAVFVAVSASYIGTTAAYNARTLELFRWYQPPALTDTEFRPDTTFAPGEGFILNYYVERAPMKCWATYMNVLDGPVSIQLPDTESQIIVDKTTRRHLKVLEKVPEHAPPGDYRIYELVYPTCEGFDMRPFKLDTGLTITVSK